MVKGRISVIIPVYNGAAWIRECLESVQAQSCQDFEVLVMDDNSTDGTTEMVQAISAEDKRIRLILRNGRGVSSARNEGIAESNGEYITFLDADDKLAPDMFEVLLGILKQEGSDMVSCGYHKWTENAIINSIEEKTSVRTVDRETYLSDYLLCQHTHCWGVLYRRSVIENTGFRQNLTIGEDMMFLMDLLPKLTLVSITDYRGYYYRVNESGATLRPFVPAYMDEIKGWKLAAEMIGRDYPRQLPKVKSIVAVSAILVAGKIARLSKKERKKYWECVTVCHDTVKEALQMPGAKENLPSGYGIKTSIFVRCPGVYLGLYHLWKS